MNIEHNFFDKWVSDHPVSSKTVTGVMKEKPEKNIGQVVSVGDEVDKASVSTTNSEALFAKEIYGLLASLEVASPGFGNVIACILRTRLQRAKSTRWKKLLRAYARSVVP